MYIGFMMLILLDILRVFAVAADPSYQGKANDQSFTTLSLPTERGTIFDRSGVPLTKNKNSLYALCVPGERSYTFLYEQVPYSAQELLYERRNSTAPFLLRLKEAPDTSGLYVGTARERSGSIPAAEHLLGYTGGDGHGVTGLESAYDALLSGAGSTTQIQCATTADGSLVEGLSPTTTRQSGTGFGVQTTLDIGIQRLCEAIACRSMTSGAIVVLEVGTADVLAAVSMPQYDPENIAESLSRTDGALIDRTMAQFCVGSVFKPVVAAAALEEGLGWYSVNCVGALEIDGQTYRCAKSIAHGPVNLRKGLEESCNCFFIRLGSTLKGEKLVQMAQKLGFGKPMEVAENWSTAAGNLPKAAELKNSGQLANFSFGQGLLMATPLQVAAMIQAIANDGVYKEPGFLQGIVDKNGSLVELAQEREEHRAMSKKTAAALRSMLTTVVTDGIGKEAAAEEGTAAGKTGTAQTGRFDRNGEELMDYWFAGFYPAETPEYAIVVLQDGTAQPAVSCAAIFSRICSQTAILKNIDNEG